ncbi:MAG: hypothetical protein WCV59_00725 [Parcubacteria group bacterium]|jgi:hypothetical protein
MNLSFSKYRLFTFFGLFWVGVSLLSIVLAMAGIFYKEIIFAYVIIFGIFLVIIFAINRQIIYQNLKFSPILIASLVFIIFLSYNTTPTIFSGRDQGSLSEAAILLSQNHNLYSSSTASQEFFKIYGQGLALNFPGFNYAHDGQLITHFPLGYVSWLAAFYSVFGTNGLIIANSITFLLFLLCFFLVSRMYMNSTFSFWTLVLVASSFVFSWFFKFTLSENLALALFWFGLWEFLLFIRRRKRLYLMSAFFSLIVLAFTRVEVLAIIPIALIVLWIKYKNKSLTEKPVARSWMLIPVILAIIVFVVSLKINWPFYLNFAKGFLNSLSKDDPADVVPYSFSSYFYLWKVLGIYALLHFIVISVLGFIYFIKNKKYILLIPFFISLPVWIYLLNPSVSMDHPWMLRRFLFAVLPIAILYSVLIIDRFFQRKMYAYVILFILFVINLFITIPYLKITENKNLLSQVEEIGANFSPSDLILVDREATGDGWTMMTGPLNFLYGKQAVYFINPSDLDGIDRNRFSNVYFIIPDKNADFYASLMDRLIFQKEYRIETNALDVKQEKKQDLFNQPVQLPKEKIMVTYGKIYQLQ